MGRYKGGLIADQKNKRIKTNDMLAARTIGYIKEGVEPVGIEGAFDKYLKGREGFRMMQRISGNVWKPLYHENEVEPEEGKDVVTTIDLNLQDVAHHSLETQLMKHNADKGCAILMEVQTGSVLAITNLKRGNDGVYREEFNLEWVKAQSLVLLSNWHLSWLCLKMAMWILMILLIRRAEQFVMPIVL
ncbi:MAG: hypothetical protein IPG39_24065 [Bacteroidetes bacterium]|nr:hypothetical protein [Bacteroidota bacterium]